MLIEISSYSYIIILRNLLGQNLFGHTVSALLKVSASFYKFKQEPGMEKFVVSVRWKKKVNSTKRTFGVFLPKNIILKRASQTLLRFMIFITLPMTILVKFASLF